MSPVISTASQPSQQGMKKQASSTNKMTQAIALNDKSVYQSLVPTLGNLLPKVNSDLQSQISKILIAISDNSEVEFVCNSAGKTPLLPAIKNEPNSKLSLAHFLKGPGIAIKKLYASLDNAEKNTAQEMFRLIPNQTISEVFSPNLFKNSDQIGNRIVAVTPIEFGNFRGFSHQIQLNQTKEKNQFNTVCWMNLAHKKVQNVKIFLFGGLNPTNDMPFEGLACVQTNLKQRFYVPIHNLNLNTKQLCNQSNLLHLNTGAMIKTTRDTRNNLIKTEWHNATFTFYKEIQNNTKCSIIKTYPNGLTVELKNVKVNNHGDPTHACVCSKIIKKPNGSMITWENIEVDANWAPLAGSTCNKTNKYPDGTEQTWLKVQVNEAGKVQAQANGHVISTNAEGLKTEWLNIHLVEGGRFHEGSVCTKKLTQTNGSITQWDNVLVNSSGGILPSQNCTVTMTSNAGYIQKLENVSVTTGGRPIENSLCNKTNYLVDGTIAKWEKVRIDIKGHLMPNTQCNHTIFKPWAPKTEWLNVTMNANGFVHNSICTIKKTYENGVIVELPNVRIDIEGKPIQNLSTREITIKPNGTRTERLLPKNEL